MSCVYNISNLDLVYIYLYFLRICKILRLFAVRIEANRFVSYFDINMSCNEAIEKPFTLVLACLNDTKNVFLSFIKKKKKSCDFLGILTNNLG